jgi:hypothetical protein
VGLPRPRDRDQRTRGSPDHGSRGPRTMLPPSPGAILKRREKPMRSKSRRPHMLPIAWPKKRKTESKSYCNTFRQAGRNCSEAAARQQRALPPSQFHHCIHKFNIVGVRRKCALACAIAYDNWWRRELRGAVRRRLEREPGFACASPDLLPACFLSAVP